jgi:L-ascorbate metabolism protein UlaG (beta-lactamase superfamily)
LTTVPAARRVTASVLAVGLLSGGCLTVALLSAGCLGVGVGGPVPGQPPHHRERGFANTNPAYARPGFWTRWSFFASRVWSTTFTPRHASFPVLADKGRDLAAGSPPRVTWVGHSTVLVQLDGVSFLTDPQWSERASPVGFAGPRRVTPPGVAFEALPAIDFVVISHDHYDHLDLPTVRRLAVAHRPRFLVPLGMKAWFAENGIAEVDELDWWGSRQVRGLTVTCVPVQHWSQRSPWDLNRRLWSGWAIAGRDRRFFFAGDTAYYDVFREVGARLGPFDLAAVAIGAYLPRRMMKATHTTPEEALRLVADVRGRRLLAIHWGTFDLADEPLDEPPRRLRAEAQRRGLDPDAIWVFEHGETRVW